MKFAIIDAQDPSKKIDEACLEFIPAIGCYVMAENRGLFKVEGVVLDGRLPKKKEPEADESESETPEKEMIENTIYLLCSVALEGKLTAGVLDEPLIVCVPPRGFESQ